MLVVPAGIFITCRRRRWVAALCILVLTPITLYFVLGAVSYFHGKPFLLHPGFNHGNPDPVYRCRYRHYGDALSDEVWVITLGHNLGVCTMIRLFGPAPGSYTGPYPTAQEAKAAVAGAARVDVTNLCRDRKLQVGERLVKLNEGVVWRIIRDTEWAMPVLDHDAKELQKIEASLGPVRACVWKSTVLIVQVPMGKRAQAMNHIVVIDLTSGRAFAGYFESTRGELD
jgi:hypothetical protein